MARFALLHELAVDLRWFGGFVLDRAEADGDFFCENMQPLVSSKRSLTLQAPIQLALLFALLTGCSTTESSSNPRPIDPATGARSYEVKGTIKEVDLAGKRVLIAHEAIRNFMAAMTMPFHVRDEAEVQGLLAGDRVSFRLWFAETTNWVDHIVILAGAGPEKGPDRPQNRLVRNVEPLKIGDLIPSYPFTNELNRAVNLGGLKGTAFALTFIYTRCPFPDFCPKMSSSFADAQKLLKADPSAPTNWHLFTITFDPTYDTPRVLRNYARAYQYDPARWSFLTGALIDIDAITEQLDLQVESSEESANLWNHKLRTVVVDANGKLQKVFIGNLWQTPELVDELVKGARATATGTTGN